ncbi:hypothetical protein [Parahaliea mediterranea]|uniref:Uncharacterized protein n=1 Tax=Parahaliea mediterranea TaxID=651086 RepID=A0A939ILF2_9GAMM|nr:hypothetical protein [Parahaliea mediterranea]MBN7796440.1 hypothetical protein [Parahaliea mediterranea]
MPPGYPTENSAARTPVWCALALAAIFALGLAPRLYSALTLGWDWYYPGSFTLVNFDEGGSCRAALDGFDYPTFVGRQTVALNSALGRPPPAGIRGDARAVKAYCHSPGHIRVARVYAALTGALTPVLVGLIALRLVPARPAVAPTAAALLALSGFHIGESHSGTVDAPSVFFIYLFLAVLVAATRGWRAGRWLAPPLLLMAVWAKAWLFAIFAYAAVLPAACWRWLGRGWSARRLAAAVLAAVVLFGCLTNTDFPVAAYPLLGLFYLLVPWRRIPRPAVALWLLLPWLAWAASALPLVESYAIGGLEGRFGAGYGAIGWHKWPRNLLNLPLVLVVGLGLPAALCIPFGARALLRDPGAPRAWLCLLPVGVFALFMLVPAVVTYYRHYLVLLPAAALLAALGYWSLFGRRGRLWLPLFLLWPALLALDLEADYHRDPRIALAAWYAEHQPRGVFATYYTNPPPGARYALFRPEHAAGGQSAPLRRADYLLLSENWYDTAFANELNGPLAGDLGKLVKTTPARARFYRLALAGELDYLEPAAVFRVFNFMPELVWHKRWYGTFQLFVGDIHAYRIVDDT